MSYPQGYPSTTQTVAYTGTAGVITNAVGDHIHRVRIYCTTDAFVAFGAAPTATTSDMAVEGGIANLFTVKPGQKVSAVQITTGGSLYVTEMTE